MVQKIAEKRSGEVAVHFLPIAEATRSQRRAAAAVQDKAREKSTGWSGTAALKALTDQELVIQFKKSEEDIRAGRTKKWETLLEELKKRS